MMTLANARRLGSDFVVVPGLRPSGRARPGEMAGRYGAETTVIDWHARLTCSGCGGPQVDPVVTGTERR
jgi:hypothetical protein